MDHPIAAALARALSAFLAPMLIACGVAAGLAYGGYMLVPESAIELGEPTPEPAQPQVIVVSAPAAAPQTPEPPAEPNDSRPLFVTIGRSDVNERLTVVDTTRTALSHLLERSPSLFTSARIVPFVEDERVVGFRLYGLSPDSPLGVLGLQNGDTVRSINGTSLTGPETALEAYARLRTAEVLDVRLSRRGRDARLLVLIHDA